MDLARVASLHGLRELPELVRMEREIDVLEARHALLLNVGDGQSQEAAILQRENLLRCRRKEEEEQNRPQIDPRQYALRVAEKRQSNYEQYRQPIDSSESVPISSALTVGDVNSDLLDNYSHYSSSSNTSLSPINIRKNWSSSRK